MMNKIEQRIRNLTYSEKELAEELKKVCDDFDFIACNITMLRKNDNDIKRVLDFIRSKEQVSSSEVNLFILKICLARKANN